MGSDQKSRTSIKVNGEEISVTSLDKMLWGKQGINKYTYLQYLSTIAPYLLPFLKDRLLTVIRFPNGINSDSFYQKNCPEYSPDFINTIRSEGIDYIICSDLQTLLWLGNQSAIEYHIPFQTFMKHNPDEIVFDLDPPTSNEFSLAVEAALIMKEIFDKLSLISFIKTSGNKGLQIYLPLDGKHTYDETRLFTNFIATYITTKYPKSFTTERLKKNRNNKLYIDFLQHGEGKTIIAPYSPRGNEHGIVASPLYWTEVKETLDPKFYTLDECLKRVKDNMLPFKDFDKAKKKQPFAKVVESLTEKS